jgi:hypothetical protein
MIDSGQVAQNCIRLNALDTSLICRSHERVVAAVVVCRELGQMILILHGVTSQQKARPYRRRRLTMPAVQRRVDVFSLLAALWVPALCRGLFIDRARIISPPRDVTQ